MLAVNANLGSKKLGGNLTCSLAPSTLPLFLTRELYLETNCDLIYGWTSQWEPYINISHLEHRTSPFSIMPISTGRKNTHTSYKVTESVNKTYHWWNYRRGLAVGGGGLFCWRKEGLNERFYSVPTPPPWLRHPSLSEGLDLLWFHVEWNNKLPRANVLCTNWLKIFFNFPALQNGWVSKLLSWVTSYL